MLKYYIIRGKQYQYEEGSQPAGAVEFKKVKPSKKAVAQEPAETPEPAETLEKAEMPANKAAPKPANKRRKAGSK